MKKRILALLLALCMLFSGQIVCFADVTSETAIKYCRHENADWKLLFPATLITEAYYTRVCPDCGFRQTAKKARTSYLEKAFDKLVSCFFLFDGTVASDSVHVTAHTGPWEIRMNSMTSLLYSLQSGADIVEFDLSLNKDGVAFMAHDADEKFLPTLEQGFAAVAKYVDIKVNVDVKNLAAMEQCQELAYKYGIADRIYYTGLFENAIPYTKEHSPLIDYYLNAGCSSDPAECAALCDKAVALGAIGLNLGYGDYSPELAAAAHERGLLISVYTVNETEDLRYYMTCDIDTITTEYPYRLYSMIHSSSAAC